MYWITQFNKKPRERIRFTIANFATGIFAVIPALPSTAITIPYCKAVLNGISGWLAANPAVMMIFDGGSFWLYGKVESKPMVIT